MKVIEKATDRKAEAHVHVEGRVLPLEEYGEYVDPVDKAICCYVPVEEGHKVKIGGRFFGTTLAVAYDVVVDGVHRKAHSTIAKTVHNQKNKKLDTGTFLYKSNEGIIDTEMLVSPLSGVNATQGHSMETIGTLELRLYITRQLDVKHTLSTTQRYYNISGSIEDEESRTISYKLLPPTFRMTFERNAALLDNVNANREKRRIDATRPGTEPWAIFRFHYRSKEAITGHFLELTYNPTSKEKTEPHALDLESVPPLVAGTKPHKDDDDDSTRASTPILPDVPSAPAKSVQKATTAKSSTSSKKQQSEPAATPAPELNMVPAAEEKPSPSYPDTPALETLGEATEDLRARVFSKPLTKLAIAEPLPTLVKAAPNDNTNNKAISSFNVNSDTGKAADTSKDKKKLPGSLATTLDGPGATDNKSGDKLTNKSIEREHSTGNGKIAVDGLENQLMVKIDDSSVKTPSLPPTCANLADGITPAITKKVPKVPKVPKVVTSPKRRPSTKPKPTISSIPTAHKKPDAVTPPATPTKRTAEPPNSAILDIKRTKICDPPLILTTPTTSSYTSPGTSDPRPLSIERKVAEQRRKLEALRKKRLETAKKQEELDKKMEPFKKRMAEELEQLNREMMEEETAAAEDDEHFNASVELWEEFEKAQGGS